MRFYISVMFLGLPDDMNEEKPSFLQLKKTERPTNGPTDGPTDGRTDPLIEMRGRIYKVQYRKRKSSQGEKRMHKKQKNKTKKTKKSPVYR